MEAAYAEMRRAGATTVALEMVANNDVARRFYEREGRQQRCGTKVLRARGLHNHIRPDAPAARPCLNGPRARQSSSSSVSSNRRAQRVIAGVEGVRLVFLKRLGALSIAVKPASDVPPHRRRHDRANSLEELGGASWGRLPEQKNQRRAWGPAQRVWRKAPASSPQPHGESMASFRPKPVRCSGSGWRRIRQALASPIAAEVWMP